MSANFRHRSPRRRHILPALAATAALASALSPLPARAHDSLDLLLEPLHLAAEGLRLFVPAPPLAGPPHYARLDCDVSPESAEVFLDGEYVGIADDLDGFPNYLWVRPGSHTIEFRHPGHLGVRRDFRASPGTEIDFDDALPRDGRHREWPRRLADDEVAVWEENADDELALDDDDDEDEDDEEWRERLDNEPYWRRQAAPRSPDAMREGTRAETSRSAILRLEIDPAGAAVYVDGKFAGVAPLAAEGLQLAPGKHLIEAVLPGYSSATDRVSLDAGEDESVSMRLRRR
ncbi:MAG: PEGA domain-containing protein [Candidatus Schekmanbacteria bacterium]|nr:PEGA domain-containing protein [Candidatus Schekmanbacteria bacterium]